MASYPKQNNSDLLRFLLERKVDPHIALILGEWDEPIVQVESSIKLLEDFTRRINDLNMNVEESMKIYTAIKHKNFGVANKMIKEYEQKAYSVEERVDMSQKQDVEIIQPPRAEQPRGTGQLGIDRIADHIIQATNCRMPQASRQLQISAPVVHKPITPDIMARLEDFKNKETETPGYAHENPSRLGTAMSVSKPINSQAFEESRENRAPIPSQSSENGARYLENKFTLPEKVQSVSVIELDKLSPDKISELFSKYHKKANIDKPESQTPPPIQYPEKERQINQPHINSHQEPILIPSEMKTNDLHPKGSQQEGSGFNIAPNDKIILYDPRSQQTVAQAGPNQVQCRDQTAYHQSPHHSEVLNPPQQYPPNESGKALILPNDSVSYAKFASGENPSSGQICSYNQPLIQNPPTLYNQPLIPNAHPQINQLPIIQPTLYYASQQYGQIQSNPYSNPQEQLRIQHEGQYDRPQPHTHSNPHEQSRMHQEGQYPVQVHPLPSQSYPPHPQHIPSIPAAICCICSSSHNQASLRQLTICNHIVHEACFVNFTTSQITRGAFPDKCPHQSCVSNLHPQDVEFTLPESYKLRFQQLYAKQALINSGIEIFECPDCQNVYEKGRLEHLQCLNCKKYYCLKCNSEAHPGEMCRILSIDTFCKSCQVDHSGMTCDQYTRYLADQYR